jgi:hypothetical protein
MLCEHLGEITDVDLRLATFENVIVRFLRKHGPTRSKDLWVRTAGRRVGEELFDKAVDSLVERRVIVRQTTNRINSFIFRMAPDKRRRERAERKAQESLSQ